MRVVFEVPRASYSDCRIPSVNFGDSSGVNFDNIFEQYNVVDNGLRAIDGRLLQTLKDLS